MRLATFPSDDALLLAVRLFKDLVTAAAVQYRNKTFPGVPAIFLP